MAAEEESLLLSVSRGGSRREGKIVSHHDRAYGTHFLDNEGADPTFSTLDDDDELDIREKPPPKGLVTGSIPSSTFNLTNSVIGAGVLALPFAFDKAGMIIAGSLLFFVYLLVMYSCWMLLECRKFVEVKSFRGVANAAYGTKGILLVQCAVIMSTFFTMASYLVIIGDMVSPAIGQWMGGTNEDRCSVFADRRFAITCSLVIVGPLAMVQNIDSLKYTSYAAICAVLYLVIIVVVRSGQGLEEALKNETPRFAEWSALVFRALPIVTLAYTCQFNIFPIVSSLKRPTRARMQTVIVTSLTTCFLVYCLVGFFGYLTFFSRVRGNLLLNYDPSDGYIMVGRMAVAIVILFSYPVLAFPCLNAIDELMFDPHKWKFSYCRRGILMSFTLGIQYVIAMTVADISVPLGIAGSTGSTLICFILPSLFFFKLSPAPATDPHKIVAAILIIIGVLCFVISTVVTILDATQEDEQDDLSFICNRTALSNNNN
eukprot:m.40800 g.40800  ORF g.40800 m.40800 type:complete len:486 (-) comp9712_c0_seq2:64-1521(-)